MRTSTGHEAITLATEARILDDVLDDLAEDGGYSPLRVMHAVTRPALRYGVEVDQEAIAAQVTVGAIRLRREELAEPDEAEERAILDRAADALATDEDEWIREHGRKMDSATADACYRRHLDAARGGS